MSTPERLYHVILRNDRTGLDTYMTTYPMPHHESTVMLRKMAPVAKSRPHLRYMLVESSTATNRYAKDGSGPARANPAKKPSGFTYYEVMTWDRTHDYKKATQQAHVPLHVARRIAARVIAEGGSARLIDERTGEWMDYTQSGTKRYKLNPAKKLSGFSVSAVSAKPFPGTRWRVTAPDGYAYESSGAFYDSDTETAHEAAVRAGWRAVEKGTYAKGVRYAARRNPRGLTAAKAAALEREARKADRLADQAARELSPTHATTLMYRREAADYRRRAALIGKLRAPTKTNPKLRRNSPSDVHERLVEPIYFVFVTDTQGREHVYAETRRPASAQFAVRQARAEMKRNARWTRVRIVKAGKQ